ncbi:Hint domain-containing protein [Paracoccus aminophilus]|nr:Hint domain-containing protein [Paracoccus aminophilus]
MPSIDIVRLDENPHETVHGFRVDTASRGVDLDGAKVTATYADGSTETLTWRAYDPYTMGGASGENIEMSFGFDWHNLSTTKLLASLKIDLQPASSVFDTTFDSDTSPNAASTPGSKEGFPFHLEQAYENISGSIAVTYSGIVNIAGSPAVGDVYTTMVIDFSQLSGGGLLGVLKWNSDIDTLEVAGDLVPTGATCLVRGTLVTTDQGDIPVEKLKPGFKVLTQDNGFQELIMATSRIVESNELERNEKLYPVRITAGALGSALPTRDLLVSRQHRMAIKSIIVQRMFGSETALVAAIRLTELPGIYVDDTVDHVEYFHLILQKHEVIFAEGTPTESFLLNLETQKTLSKAQREEFATLFPEIGLGTSAHMIPSNALQKELIRRHLKNAKALLTCTNEHGSAQ